MNHVFRRTLSRVLPLMLVLIMLFGLATTASAADLSGLTDSNIGLGYTEASNGGTVKWAAAGTSLEGSVQGVKDGPFYKAETSTLLITNKKDVTALVSFDYSIDNNGGTVQIDGAACTGTGSINKELAAGESVTIVVTAARLTKVNTVTLNISGLSLVADRDAVTTFRPAEEGGSYTVKNADGEVLDITAETVLTQHSTQPYTLQATATEGFVFFGWYNVTGDSYFSYSETTSYMTDQDNTLRPVFVSSEYALFETGGKKFRDLNEASDYAVAQGLETIVLINSGYISGDFVIDEGVTLLIPFDEANTCFTNAPGHTGTAWTKPTPFRTLTLTDGSTITVNGAISVSARHTAGTSASSGTSYLGSPSGPCGFIDLGEDAEIIVGGTGKLYAWGYIVGDGKVTAKSGAEVYENIQFADFRGGSASLVLAMGDYMAYGIFPMSQYYVQNVEVPLILESGSNEYVWTSVTMNNQNFTAGVKFIGSGAMFVAEEGGSITKQYVAERDRLQIDVDGSGSINSLTIELQGNRIDTSDYFLPLTNNLTINILSGTTTVTQDMSVLPGAEISVAEGAALKVGENSELYIYDADEWDKYQKYNEATGEYYDVTGGNFVYNNRKINPLTYVPSRAYNRTAADIKDVLVDVNGTLSVDGHIYTTRGGANVMSSKGTGRVYMNSGLNQEYLGAEGLWFTFQAIQEAEVYLAYIPATSIKLHNGDGNYTETEDAESGEVYIWSQHFGKWVKLTDVTLSYDGNGGTGTMDSVTVSKAAILEGTNQVTLAANGFTKAHHTFEGWATAPDGEVVYQPGAQVAVEYDLKLYAVWKPVTYTISYFANDGWTATADAVYGVEYRIPANSSFESEPAKTGYTFQGWSTTENGAVEYTVGNVVNVTSDMSLYAVWKENTYTVSFRANGGTGLMDDVEIGQVTPSDLPECTFGHNECSIVGWALTPDGDVVYEDMETITATQDMTLYAIWGEKSYKVTFDANGGEGTMKKQTIGTVTESALDANEFTREGHTFRVWNTKADGTGKSYVAGNMMTLSADVVLYAVWDINQYDVELDFNGGSITDGGATKYSVSWKADYGTVIKLDEFPAVNSYYELAGWATTRNATDAEYAVDEEITVKEAITLYAVWQEKSATVTYDANGGTGTMDPQEYLVVTGVKLTANGFTREGYTFNGWNTKADGTGTVFSDGAQFNLPEDTTLYAQWKINVYTVTWLDDDGMVLEKDIRVPYGTEPAFDGETPHKVADIQYTYNFAGWTPELVAVTGDAIYTAVYTSTVNKYTVTWKDYDGTVLATTVVPYGQMPVYTGETPAKDATEEFTYIFAGWDKEITPVTGTVTYTAAYTAQLNKFTVTWKNADGTVLETDSVEYGTVPAYDGETPVKAADDEYTYTFAGWTPEVAEVTGDAVYTATYTETPVVLPHEHSYTGEVTTEPSYSAPGEMTYTCSCGDSYTEPVPALGNPFVDVHEGDFYYTPVLWAVDEGITTGTTATTFSPMDICNRAQFVTFLWRLAGEPEPVNTEMAFTDVEEGSFYHKAVLWAIENGITNGTSATTFSPNAICNRAQVVTFLWRYAGKPEPTTMENPFEDVIDGEFYYDAVLWAVEEGITNGMSATTFGPGQNCLRGQTVTFLYRFGVKEIVQG